MDPSTEEAFIEFLRPHVSEDRVAKMEAVVATRTEHIRVVLEDIYQPHNASAVMRSCECFGIQHLDVIENNYTFAPNRDVAMGSAKWINLHRHRIPDDSATVPCLQKLKDEGYHIVATALDKDSIPLHTLPIDQKIALCFGTEKSGLSEEAIKMADTKIQIPMFGFTQSFNISVSAALCLYDLCTRLHASDVAWQLPKPLQREILRKWMLKTVRNPDHHKKHFLKTQPNS